MHSVSRCKRSLEPVSIRQSICACAALLCLISYNAVAATSAHITNSGAYSKTQAASAHPQTPATGAHPQTPATGGRPPDFSDRWSPPDSSYRWSPPDSSDRWSPQTPVTGGRPQTPATGGRPQTPAVSDHTQTPVTNDSDYTQTQATCVVEVFVGATQDALCPVRAIVTYTAQRGKSRGPFFKLSLLSESTGSPHSHQRFSRGLRGT